MYYPPCDEFRNESSLRVTDLFCLVFLGLGVKGIELIAPFAQPIGGLVWEIGSTSFTLDIGLADGHVGNVALHVLAKLYLPTPRANAEASSVLSSNLVVADWPTSITTYKSIVRPASLARQ